MVCSNCGLTLRFVKAVSDVKQELKCSNKKCKDCGKIVIVEIKKLEDNKVDG